MKIAFLDASTLGDTCLQPLRELGKLTCHDVTDDSNVIAHSSGAEIIITNKVKISRETMAALPELKLICIAATGMNCVDLDAAKELSIPVKNVAGYSTEGVVQHTIGMMINLFSNMHRYDAGIGTWPDSPIFTQLHLPITDLAGKTLGIIGYGTIGQAVAKIAEAFGMNVIALARDGATADPLRRAKEDFFQQSDVISLHCPLSPKTENIINPDTLALMKPTAFLINTGRGDLIDEHALHQALKEKKIAGAALDVLTQEPPNKDHILMQGYLENLMITPHTAWASTESRDKLITGVANNIASLNSEVNKNLTT